MTAVDQLSLISDVPFNVDGIDVYPPKLRDIRCVGYDEYESYLSIFFLTADNIGKIIGVDVGSLPSAATPLQLITCIPELRVALLRALRFFLHVDVMYDQEVGYFILQDDETAYISLEHIKKIRSVALQFCNVSDDIEQTPVKFKNDKAKRIYEKIQKKKAEKKARSTSSPASLSMTLPNLISAVAAYSPTYNYFNIWDLTVYQFYDQFARLNDIVQMKIIGQRWAAWGTENFDFSVWYRSLQKNP